MLTWQCLSLPGPPKSVENRPPRMLLPVCKMTTTGMLPEHTSRTSAGVLSLDGMSVLTQFKHGKTSASQSLPILCMLDTLNMHIQQMVGLFRVCVLCSMG